ncbi:hypothetical protein AB4305_27410 [Nocardia sp. 2YAB30]|uniref:hypothetical protein n=1 Tax=Nocardia sp. 2YAB30 TaxID=3233022 RepID=UPI003F9D829B
MFTPGADAKELRRVIQELVGGFLHNTYVPGVDGVCTVCRGASNPSDSLCGTCRDNRNEFSSLLADRTVQLTYAQGYHPNGLHQSAHEVRAYKDIPPVIRCRQNLRLVTKSAVALHTSCLTGSAGSAWDSVTFVGSAQRPGLAHPLAEFVGDIRQIDPTLPMFLLQPGPNIAAGRRLVTDRFKVGKTDRAAVDGKHVLIIDDTWVSGASAQGAAIAAKLAGAHTVTLLCIARWLSWNGQQHKTILESLTNPYDPLACPVHRRVCQPAATFSATQLRRRP